MGIPFELANHDDRADAEAFGGVSPRRRSLWALGALAIGYAGARAFGADLVAMGWGAIGWFAAAQGVMVLAVLARGRWCRAALLAAAVLFGAGWFTFRMLEGSSERLDVLLRSELEGDHPVLVTVHGRVIEPSRRVEARVGMLGAFARTPAAMVMAVRTTRVETGAGPVRASGIVRVSLPATSEQVPPNLWSVGDLVRVTGQFKPIPGPLNPGDADRRLLALQDGVVGRLASPSMQLVEVTETGGTADIGGGIVRAIGWVRSRAKAALGLDQDDEQMGNGRRLMAAMLLGEREHGYEEVDAAFRRIGLVHLVAISGFNLAVLAQATGLLVRLCGDRGRWEPAIVAGVVSLYLIVVPAEAPILRAGVTLLVFLIAEACGRRYDRLTLLGWTACILILWRPMDLWSLGFQLSFGIVATLLWLADRAQARMFGVPLRGVVSVGWGIGERPGWLLARAMPLWRWCMSKLKTAVTVSLLAWAVAMPVIMTHTGMVSPWAPLTGLLAVPLAIAVLYAGYAALAVGFISPWAGGWLVDVTTFVSDLLARLVTALDAAPASAMETPRISAWWAAAAVGGVLYWFSRGSWCERRTWAVAGIVLCWMGAEFYFNTRLRGNVALRVDTLAVGDGTCHLIRSGDEAMLWDCGSSHPGFGLREIPRAVRALGAGPVRSVLVTHANLDHFGCLPDVVQSLGVERVWVTRALLDDALREPRGAPAALLQHLESMGVVVREIHAGERLPLGGASCEILWPHVGQELNNANDTSLVGVFRAPTREGEKVVMMTGDIGPAAIGVLLESAPALQVDALELPHHGSFNTEAVRLVQMTDPDIVVQSTGPQRLNDARWDVARPGRIWHVTARDGAAWIEIRAGGDIRTGSFRRPER